MPGDFDVLIKGVNKIIKDDRAFRVALSSVLPIHKKRIFESGTDADGNKIGTYSTRPISIARSKQARNTGHTYFKGGYDQYKSEIGKNPGYVNFRNTDQMQADYGLQVLGNNQFGFGFNNGTNHDKSEWGQDHFNKDVFQLSQAELDLFGQVLNEELQK